MYNHATWQIPTSSGALARLAEQCSDMAQPALESMLKESCGEDLTEAHGMHVEAFAHGVSWRRSTAGFLILSQFAHVQSLQEVDAEQRETFDDEDGGQSSVRDLLSEISNNAENLDAAAGARQEGRLHANGALL